MASASDEADSLEDGQFLWPNEELDSPGLTRDSLDELTVFEFENHPMNSRRCDLEVSLHIPLRGRSSMNLGVRVDEGQILALLVRKVGHGIDIIAQV